MPGKNRRGIFAGDDGKFICAGFNTGKEEEPEKHRSIPSLTLLHKWECVMQSKPLVRSWQSYRGSTGLTITIDMEL